MNTTIHPNSEKLSQFLWTAFILVFFALQAILWAFAISLTAGDRSHSVVAGHDQQALHWDDVRDARSNSDALGWQAKLSIGSDADALGKREVVISLTDRSGSPVDQANIQLNVFHCGRSADVISLEPESAGDGRYRTAIAFRKTGYWKFTGTASTDDAAFLIDKKIWIEGSK